MLPSGNSNFDGMGLSTKGLMQFEAHRVMRTVSRVLIPVDLEAVALEPIEYASWLIANHNARADILYISRRALRMADSGREDPEREAMLELIASIMEWFYDHCSPQREQRDPCVVGHIIPGFPAQSILDFSRSGRHDFIVMGACRKARPDGGSQSHVVEGVVQSSQVPVLVFPAVERRAAHEVEPSATGYS